MKSDSRAFSLSFVFAIDEGQLVMAALANRTKEISAKSHKLVWRQWEQAQG